MAGKMSKKKVMQMQRRRDDLELLCIGSPLICKRCDTKLLSEIAVTIMASDGSVTFELLRCTLCGQKYAIPLGEYWH